MMALKCLVLCLGLVAIVTASESSLVEEFRKEIESLKATTASLQTEMGELKRENQQLKEQQTSKRFMMNPLAEKPAFSASLSKHMTNLGNYQTIVFDRTFTNDLGAYSPVTGVFNAPMNGTYYFTASILSHSGQYLETEICLNGNTIVYMYSYDAHYEQGCNSVVLPLTAGDRVWVRHQANEGSSVFGANWSTFSGFML